MAIPHMKHWHGVGIGALESVHEFQFSEALDFVVV
jgi:hypothetical protein